MKTNIVALAATATVFAASLPAAAQTPTGEVFIYATYFHCNNTNIDHADRAVTDLYRMELNDMVKEGSVSSWGWLGKHAGGEWARAGYLTGPSVKAVLDAGDKLDAKSDAKPPVKIFNEACSSGEDYIWHILAGNDARGHRGKYAFSTYYVCEQSREAQADALVKRVFAPMYDKLVASGKLISWGWAEHIVGGKYRRLATMSAETLDSLMAARQELITATEHDPLDDTMGSICGSHQDYIWDVRDQGS